MNLILASSSPRRKYILEDMGVPFSTIPAQVNEWTDSTADPCQLVIHNSLIKAESVADQNPDSPVLAADTTVALENQIFNKPDDLNEARSMLRQLSGKNHTVYTGLCLIFSAREIHEARYVSSEVTFKTLDADAIEHYFALVNPLDKAGAYGIQQGRDIIIDRYCGSLTNIMGLPAEETVSLLEKHGLLTPLKTP